jgi:hypothetical protein
VLKLKNAEPHKKELTLALTYLPKSIRIPGNDENGVRLPPEGGRRRRWITEISYEALICLPYRKAASKKAQAPSWKFTTIPFSI